MSSIMMHHVSLFSICSEKLEVVYIRPFPDLGPCLSELRLGLLDAGCHRVHLSHLKGQQWTDVRFNTSVITI